MNTVAYVLVVILVVAAVGTYALLPTPRSVTTRTVSTTTSTTMTSCTSKSLEGSNTTTLKGIYSTGNSSWVRIDSVKALVYADQSGQRTLRFEVGFTNVGNSSIYILVGCGSTLNSTITSGSDVVRTVSGGARCLCAEALSPLREGQNATEFEPGCWSGYSYQVMQPGTFTAKLTLGWYGSDQFGSQGHVQITVNFTVQ